MIQKEPSEGEDQIDIILLTHRSIEKQRRSTRSRRIEALPTVRGKVVRIRLEVARLMRYVSTRGAWHDAPQPFCDILLEGLAPDGGLAVPRAYAALHAGRARRAARRSTTAQLAFEVLSRFIDDIPPRELRAHRRATRTRPRDVRQRRDHAARRRSSPACTCCACPTGRRSRSRTSRCSSSGSLFEYVLARAGPHASTSSARRPATPARAAEYAMRGKRGVARVHAVAATGA